MERAKRVQRPRHIWTDEEIAYIATLDKTKMPFEMIAHGVQEKFGFSCSAKMVRNAMRRGRVDWVYRGRTISKREMWSEARLLHETKVSNILHLLDLKRAGHSPRDTEYRIGNDGAIRMEAPIAYTSGVGSPAAMCAVEL